MKVKNMILVSLFAALTAVGAFIKVPIPYVPITLQYLFCAFAGILLGAKLGVLSQALYVGLGLIGLPIFTNGGGIGYVVQPTFGFLVGLIISSYVIGIIYNRASKKNFITAFGATMLGVLILYIFGGVYFYLIQNLYLGKDMPFEKVMQYAIIPFILGDTLKCVIISSVATPILKILNRAGIGVQ